MGAWEKFLICVFSFIAATAMAVCYGLNLAVINLCLALAMVLWLNPTQLTGKKFVAGFLLALVLAVISLLCNAKMWSVWLFAGFTLSLFIMGEKNTEKTGVLLILTAAFFNLAVISNSGYTDIQYDIASCFNYVEYILENNFMFWRENPLLTRPSYSTYHPILHFFLAAGIMRGVMLFTANMTAAAEAAQVLFCSYMLWYYFIAARIFKRLHIAGGVYLACLSFVVFFPMYNAIAGFFNNDALLLPLQAGTIYYALSYLEDGGRKNLFYIFVFATAAALTKLSGGLVLPMVGGVLCLRLWRVQDKQTLTELMVFSVCLLCGISLWTIYQHFVLGVTASFVPPQEHLSLKQYTLWERFNPLGALFYEKMFYNDFGINLWETMTKTALFGQWDFSYRGVEIIGIISLLVVLYKLILVLTLLGIIYLVWREARNVYLWLILILLLSLLSGQVAFGLMHPYMCNQDFRYVALLPLPMALIWGLGLKGSRVWIQKTGFTLLGLFAGSSAVVWWWVVSAFGG